MSVARALKSGSGAPPTIIAGVDPGSRITGFGCISVQGNCARWLDSGVITIPPQLELAKKLQTIHRGLEELFYRHRPDVVCVEEAFYAKNVRTTLVLGHARGVALLAAAQCGARVEEYTPRAVKKALVGNGGATKEQVAYMVKFMLSPPQDHAATDAYDALAVALCGFAHISFGTAVAARRG
jgi:crossover junction endodeoxyribonuclease RuvC